MENGNATRRVGADFVQEACGPMVTLLGNVLCLLSKRIQWEFDVPDSVLQVEPNEILAWLLSAQGKAPATTVAFHDGEKHHGVAFLRIDEGRVFFEDSFGDASMLISGDNRMKIKASHHQDDEYSFSCDEFEEFVALACIGGVSNVTTIVLNDD